MEARQALERLGGVATASELLTLTSRARLRTALKHGHIVRLHRGRFSLKASPVAAKDAAAVSGVVSHLSAALHWGWPVMWVPERVWVTVPGDRKRRAHREGRVILVRSDLPPDDIVNGVTVPLRTVLDCARRLPFAQALAVADSALRSGLVAPLELRVAAESARGPGSRGCRRVAREASSRPANPFESALRAIALGCDGLAVEPQVAVATRYRTYHPDLVDRRLRLAIEADSWEFHAGKDAHGRDCARYTHLTLAGWRVLRFTWEQVMLDPGYVAESLAAAVTLTTTHRP